MAYWYLMAIVYSNWDGSVVSSKKMARFKTQNECVQYLDTLPTIKRDKFLCLPDAIEIEKAGE